MKPKLLLRIASIIMLLHTVGHTMGALTWKDAPNATIAGVIAGMINNHFNFMGRSVTLGLFFDGYGVINLLILLLISTWLWLLSNNTENRLARPLIITLAVFLIAQGITEYVYFFLLPMALSLLAGICALVAGIRSKPA